MSQKHENELSLSGIKMTAEAHDRHFFLQAFGYENGFVKITNPGKSVSLDGQGQKLDDNTICFQLHHKFVHSKGSIEKKEKPCKVNSLCFGTINEIPYLLSAGDDGRLILIDYSVFEWRHTVLAEEKTEITSVSFSNNSKKIAYANANGEINFLFYDDNEMEFRRNVDKEEETKSTLVSFFPRNINGAKHEVYLVSFSDDGVLSFYKKNNGGDNRMIYIFNTVKTDLKKKAKAIAVNHSNIAVLFEDNTIIIYDYNMRAIDAIMPFKNNERENVVSIYWQDYLNKLIILTQKIQIKNDLQGGKSTTFEYIDAIANKHEFIQSPAGIWISNNQDTEKDTE